MSTRPSAYRIAVALGALAAISPSVLPAQSPSDGMMPARVLSAGVVYAHDSWSEYWEGTLKRSNGNIGTLTTQSVTAMLGYGVTDRLSVMAALPYVSTHASQGVLADMSGLQDLTVAVRYKLFRLGAAQLGALSGSVTAAAALPVSDYTPDFFPLSIGTGGGRAVTRAVLDFQAKELWFASVSAGYTWCSNVKLDRNSYYTDGQLYMTNEVAMPNVADYTIGGGVAKGRFRVPLALTVQRTLGGGDIRRQDMPFVSNRMNFTRLQGTVMYALPIGPDVSVGVGAAHVLSGRNVGQSTTITSGLFYALHF